MTIKWYLEYKVKRQNKNKTEKKKGNTWLCIHIQKCITYFKSFMYNMLNGKNIIFQMKSTSSTDYVINIY